MGCEEVAAGAPGGPPLRVERAPLAQLEALGRLAASWLPEVGSATGFAASAQNPRVAVWVARRAGARDAPLGVVSTFQVADELHVHALAVAPGARRRGVASALLAAALRSAAQQGVAEVQLEVKALNGAARALYAGAGFRMVGRRPRYYADGDDALLLNLQLGDGAGTGSTP